MPVKLYPNFSAIPWRKYIFTTVFILFLYSTIRDLASSSNSSREIPKQYHSIQHTSLSQSNTLNCYGDPLQKWCRSYINLCDSSLIVYNSLFVQTQNIILQPQYATGKSLGGENIQDVLNQPEEDEYFRFEQGFIKLRCNNPIELIDQKVPDNHLLDVFSSLTYYETNPVTNIIDETTIAVRRQDYVNFYHTITDLYTVFLLCKFFQRDPKSVRILFIDAHPKGNLDILWSKLFHSYTRLGHLKNSTSILYRDLIWSQPQPKSEIDVTYSRITPPSFLKDFREHILKEFDIDDEDDKKIDCDLINIFFLVRHDYVAHPRNPTGKITRQLSNEQQVIDELKQKFSSSGKVNFTVNHFEDLTIEEQFKIIVGADVFVGMHGAGLTHVLFLKPGRTLIELAPSSSEIGKHYKFMALMSNVLYDACLINNGSPEVPTTIFGCIKNKFSQMCSNSHVL